MSARQRSKCSIMEYEQFSAGGMSHTPQYLAAFYSTIDQYYEEGILTDVTISTRDNREFKCHKLVLAVISEYFKKMFTGSWKECQSGRVELVDIYGETFERVLEFAYKGRVLIDDANVHTLLRLSDRLGLKTLEDRCVRYLTERNIPINQAFDIFSFACLTQKNAVITSVSRFILEHLEHLHGDEERLLGVILDDMKTLLSYWRPTSSRKEHVLLYVLRHWVSHSMVANQVDKISLWEDFMQTSPFQHISKEFIERCLEENDCDIHRAMSNLHSGVKDCASESLALHIYSSHSKKTSLFTLKTWKEDIEWYPPIEIENDLSEVIFTAINHRLYSYSEKRRAFSAYSSVTLSDKQSLRLPIGSNEYLHQDVEPFFLLCGDPISSRIYLYHDFTSLSIANLFTYNCEIDQWYPININDDETLDLYSMTYSDNRLYAINGLQSAVLQAYDLRVGKWEKLANCDWNLDRFDRSCGHKGKIYVSRETKKRNKDQLVESENLVLEIYDPVAGKWSTNAPPPPPQEIHIVTALKSFENEVWFFGVYEEVSSNQYFYPVQRYDPCLQKWGKGDLLDEGMCYFNDIVIFRVDR